MPATDDPGLHIIAALIILLREIIVSGLREFLAPLNVSMPVSASPSGRRPSSWSRSAR